MEKIRYRLVYNRQKRLNRQGMALVQVEAYLNRRKVYFTTNVYLRPEHWDGDRAQVTGHPQAEELNVMLFEFVVRLQGIELGLWKRGVTATLALLKKSVKGNEPSGGMTFMRFAQQAIEDSDKRDSTKGNLKTTLAVLRGFRSGIDFKDLTYCFLKEFEQYMREEGKHVNTIAKHMRQLRTLVNEAVNCGYMRVDDYPFRKYRIREMRGSHTYLTPDELERVESVVLDDGRLRHVRDAFLFCCYTGLRFSDFRSLEEGSFVRIGGKRWLVVRMRKTDGVVRIPLHLLFDGKALAVMGRYGDMETMAHVGDNAEVNRMLKGVMELAGIGKRVTFHTSRHTCAVLLLHQGVPVTTVQRLLGHTDIKTTQVYAEVMADTVVRDLQAADRWRGRVKS